MYVAIKFLQFPVYSDCLRQAEIVQVKKSSCPCVAVTPKQLYFLCNYDRLFIQPQHLLKINIHTVSTLFLYFLIFWLLFFYLHSLAKKKNTTKYCYRWCVWSVTTCNWLDHFYRNHIYRTYNFIFNWF